MTEQPRADLPPLVVTVAVDRHTRRMSTAVALDTAREAADLTMALRALSHVQQALLKRLEQLDDRAAAAGPEAEAPPAEV
jgi:hypothetical protein